VRVRRVRRGRGAGRDLGERARELLRRLVRKDAQLERVSDLRSRRVAAAARELRAAGAFYGPASDAAVLTPFVDPDDGVRVDALEVHDCAADPERRRLIYEARVVRVGRAGSDKENRGRGG